MAGAAYLCLAVNFITIVAAAGGIWIDSIFKTWSIIVTIYKVGIFSLLIGLIIATGVVDYKLIKQGWNLLKLKFKGKAVEAV